MTMNFPKLYPGHRHHWEAAEGPVWVQGHSHSEPICAWPDCATYLTPPQMQEKATQVRCTVCGFTAPRTLAKLDGEHPCEHCGNPHHTRHTCPERQTQPEQETA